MVVFAVDEDYVQIFVLRQVEVKEMFDGSSSIGRVRACTRSYKLYMDKKNKRIQGYKESHVHFETTTHRPTVHCSGVEQEVAQNRQ